MRIELIRSDKNRPIGFLVIWHDRRGAFGVITVPPTDYDHWRICESCGLAEADVFCRSHFKFFCRTCVKMHDVFRECDLLSRAACRELVARNLSEIRKAS
jgi:hypothetical protein